MAEEICQSCRQTRGVTVHKILFRLNMSRAPHGVAPESTLCPCCDPLWSSTGERPLPLPAGTPAGAGAGNNYQRTASAVSTTAAIVVSSESDYAAALAGKKKKPTVTSAVSGAGAGAGATAFHRGGGGSSMVSITTAAEEEESPLCGCNVASKQLTVSKEGPNKGRKFFSCVKSRYA